jgi:hypothetical protein
VVGRPGKSSNRDHPTSASLGYSVTGIDIIYAHDRRWLRAGFCRNVRNIDNILSSNFQAKKKGSAERSPFPIK